ncbi:MAG TPA: AAA+ family ATPase, partial [Acidobacteriota bacterium]|nr:AAA+ family ATPase [Acidobacteriota bacterium]
VQPGETIATFTDALRRVSDKAKYIHQDGNRYWVSTKPNLNRMAEDRASNFRREPETLYAEIARRLMAEQKARGDFAAVHPCPETPGDVPDDPEARLVILPPQFTHRKGQTESSALKTAQQFLEFKGSGPRLERNTLVFLAADERERDALLDGVAQFLAWKSIDDENEALNLDAFQRNQCRTKRIDSDKTVDLRIAATWIHVLVPTQPTPTESIVWDEIKVTGDSGLAQRTSSKLKQEEVLITEMGGIPLQMALNRYLWTDKDHVSVGLLTQWFFRYLYLPRVKNAAVLVEAVKNGVAQMYLDETFAIASGYDEAQKRYIGLTYTKSATVFVDRSTLVVKPAVAKLQIEAETRQQPDPEVVEPSTREVIHQSGPGKSLSPSPGRTELKAPAPPGPPTVFIGSVRLNDQRIGRDAGRIAEEVIQHLSTLPGAEIEVTMEIKVHVSGGIKEQVVRT